MPKPRRKKNQRFLDNKSRLNDQIKRKQLREQQSKEKEQLDDDADDESVFRNEDDNDDVESLDAGRREESVPRCEATAHVEAEEEVVAESGNDVPGEIISGVESVTDSATNHASGTLPKDANVPRDTLCSQHEISSTAEDTEVVIEHSDGSMARGVETTILDSAIGDNDKAQISSNVSDTAMQKIDDISPRSMSPDRQIISNENAAICDITPFTDTTTTQETSKASLEDEHYLSCDSDGNDEALLLEASNSTESSDNCGKGMADPIELSKHDPFTVISASTLTTFTVDEQILEDVGGIHRKDENPITPIRHPIVQEVVTILYPSRVESPKPMTTKRSAAGPLMKSKSLDDDDIMIQEMSDGSSTGDMTDNQPLISEASESGTDTDTGPPDFEEKIDPRILSVQTLPLHESPTQTTTPADGKSAAADGCNDDMIQGESPQDMKARRARNRAALEIHFMPQFLNPRYLDSIKEENSDTSDLESKSPVRERSTSMGDLEDDVFAETSKERRASAPSTPKADSVFPKSHLDFTQKHKHLSTLRSPQTTIIREESPCYAVETKLIEPPESVEERCSEWTTKHVQHSTDAVEVVYIDSASSSSSSLNELDYTDSTITNGSYEDDSSEAVHIETPTIESHQDGADIFGDLERTPTREMPDVIESYSQYSRLSDASLRQPATEQSDLYKLSDTSLQQIPAAESDVQHDSLAARHGGHEQQQPANNNTAPIEATTTPTATEDRAHRTAESSWPEDFSVTTDTQLNQKRLSVNANTGQSAVERETFEYSSEYKQEVLIHPDFEIGGPCSNNMFAALLSPLIGNRNNTSESSPSSLTPAPVTPVSSTDALNKPVSEDNCANRGELVRQDSTGSHCSVQSQNTVINRGSSNEFGETEFTYRTIVSFSPKDLRQICLEQLACMPYGKVILEELASVSEALNDLTEQHQQNQVLKIQNLKDIKEMPYPRPDLPNISDLIVPKRPEDPTHVKLMMAPPPPSKQLSPPPPPVPQRPSLESTWLGVPTDEHPNVLVCLSPAQRDYINSSKQTPKSRPEPTPDTLLDMHQKFVQRRGYHELASDVVAKIDRAKSTTKKLDQIVSSSQLSKNTSPPPIPPPPLYEPQTQRDETQTTAMTSKKPPLTVKAQNGSSNGGVGDRVTTLDDLDDKNNHRLLAIIRNSQQPLTSVKQTTQEKVHQHINSATSSQSVRYEEKLGQTVQSTERLPPEVPPRFSTSDIRSHGTANCAPHSDAPTPSEMSSTTSTSFSDTPWSDHHFDFGSTKDFQKRFSNIEHKSPFCSQIRQTQPKRFSNIETTTTTSKKRVENGNVVYDISDTQREKVRSGDDPLAGKTNTTTTFRSPPSAFSANKTGRADVNSSRTTTQEKVSEHHDSSSTKTFSQLFENRTKRSDLHKPPTTTTTTTTPLLEQQKQDNFAYDEFRQRAKESAEELAKSEFLERQNFLLKDFDELTKLIKDDLFLSDSKTTENRTSQTQETIEQSKFSRVNAPGGAQHGSSSSTEKHSNVRDSKEHTSFNIPIRLENGPTKQQSSNSFENRTMHQKESTEQTVHKERTVPIRIEKPLTREIPNMSNSMGSLPTTPSNLPPRERHLSERRLSSQNLDEWMRYIDHLGASSDNITKPLQKEVELCAFGRRPTIRAPRLTSTDTGEKLSTRLSQSTSNLSTIGTEPGHHYSSHPFGRTNSLVDSSPISPFVTPRNLRQRSVPKEINDSQLAYIRQKEAELHDEFDKLEQDRRRLIEEMDQVHQRNRLRKDVYFHQSCRLPTLSEDEAFRQQMHDEWLDKVAEREERRMHKIVKISGASNDLAPQVPFRNVSIKKAASTTNLSDEFLGRVKERRSKLCMPSDSDWESGAESQPVARSRKDKTPPQVKVIEGQSERDFKNLPPHLREFAEITNQIIQDHYQPESGHRNANKDNNNEPSRKEGDSKGSRHTADILKATEQTSNVKTETKPILRNTRETTGVHNKLMTRKKETRFKLTPNRRSWSESDLLREIDNALTLSKGFLFGAGVWSPSELSAEHSSSKSNRQGPTPPPPPPPPIWSPQASPTPARKEFRPVKFESPVLRRKGTTQRHDSGPVIPPWTNGDSTPFFGTPYSSSCSNLAKDTCADGRRQQEQQIYQLNLQKSGSVGSNLAQRPTGASYTVTNRPQLPKDQKPAFVRPNEIVYQLKNEYMSEPESENDRPKKMAQLARRQFDGIGPMTKDGMPIVLRSEVKENNQHQWYKKMYNTLHKTKPDDEYVTIRYKTHRGRLPFKSSGYMSEPEPNYDSDYSTMKYHTLDRRRVPSTGSYQEERNYGTMPNPVRPSQGSSYKNQPGKIENYITGHSSVSEKEKKESLEQQKLSSNYTEGYLSRALKEGGYESDSNVVFRKRENSDSAPLSPIEQKQAYRSVQAGGEPPLHGFRKQAPEKPKDDKEIEYFPITSTLTKIRVHANNERQQHQQLSSSRPPTEVVCYPITNISRPLDLFAPFPKNVPSFIPANPPAPPCRNSSRSNTALKIVSAHYSTSSTGGPHTAVKQADARHQACLRSEYYQHESPNSKFGTLTIRKQTKHQQQPVVRSKSVGTVTTSSRLSSMVKEERKRDGNIRLSREQIVRVRSVSPTRQASRLADLRKSSPSPVAFGRSVSKERMFAEEKKRLEKVLPLTRKSFTASTNILKDPKLKSAEQVKRAVRTSYSLAKSGQASSNLSIYGAVTKKNEIGGRKEQQTTQISINSSFSSRKPNAKTAEAVKTIQHESVKRMPKKLSKTSSTLSLARTSSTFSVDSTGSRKKDSKKPLTVTRFPRDSLPPRTISFQSKQKRKSPPKEIVATSKVHKRFETTRHDGGLDRQTKINNSIVAHHEAVRSDSFFQNLFLKSSSIATHHEEIAELPSNSVIDKARYFNSISARSEPSLRRTNVYLLEKRPVTDSKFLTKVTRHVHKSRSLSPSYRKLHSGGRVLHATSNIDSSIFQMSEDESEFGDTKPCRMDELIYKYEQRSTSEPRVRSLSTEVGRSSFPMVTHRRKASEYLRSMSPDTRETKPLARDVRSPSRRRIDSFRESQRDDTRKIVRASSVSSGDDRRRQRIYTASELSHSTGSLNIIEGHSAICPHRTSPRFKELNRFYRNVERVGQLEKATSSTDLHPIRKEGELIDFDVWKKVRAHERAEKELNHLLGKLKHDQRERDLFFRPKDVTDVKWKERFDSGLRCKEKSVENIKEAFEKREDEDDMEEVRHFKISSSQDIYRPHWRGNSVVDVASNMIAKYNTQPKVSNRMRSELRPFLSNNLISTLSSDQVSKIKNQLSEIYSNPSGPSAKAKQEIREDFIITVDDPARSKVDSLKVRCNSTISKEELLGATLKRRESSQMRSVERKPSPFRLSRESSTKSCSELSEVEKKRLSLTISRELQEKVVDSFNRNLSPSLLARETRGAVAAENAKKTLPDLGAQKDFISVEQHCETNERRTAAGNSFSEERKQVRKISRGESESNISDTSKATVIFRTKPTDGILNTIKLFEEKKSELPPKTIYHAREYSSPDEEEVLKEIQAKLEAREKETADRLPSRHSELCSSASDFKELFGERRQTFHIPPPPPLPDESREWQHRSPSSLSNESSSFQALYRSRSASPATRSFHKCHLNMVQTGDVRKITDKFETLQSPSRNIFFELCPPRRIRSDPELNRLINAEGKFNPFKVTIRNHEAGDVSWITHKFELKNNSTRGRSRVRKSYSPILRNPLRKDNRLMPHIDIISKTASLKQEVTRGKTVPKLSAAVAERTQCGEVDRIRNKFESQENASFLGQMYTSSPDISELRDISSYLSVDWIAHKYPKKRDNARSPICPEQGPESVQIKRRRHAISAALRPNSTSPPRSKSLVASILKPYYDMFADQQFDPSIHRPISRYVPDEDGTGELSGHDVWNKVRTTGLNRGPATVKFQESDVSIPPPPPPPLKNYIYREESPRRYVEGDVNIHYKSPIRYEYKDAIPDEELGRKQAESMKKVYQEERRRKYLQELEDMNNRRHTDNFIQSQKSPIALNRYDDFPTDISPKSPSATINLPNTVARALYNFQGQTARELSFRKGDVIYIRRQIDKNWYEGEHNAMIGLLPVNYVEIITKDGSRPPPPRKPSEGQARAKYTFQAQSAIELSLNKGELVTLTRRVDGNWFEGKIANRKGIFPVSYVDVLTDIGTDEAVLINSVASKPLGSTRTIITTTTNNTSPSLDELRTSLNNEFNHLTNGGQHPNGILRESKTTQKTEVLHVDTNSEPIAYRALYKYVPQNNDELELFEGDVVYVLEKCDDGWYVGTSERTGHFGTFPGNYVERA